MDEQSIDPDCATSDDAGRSLTPLHEACLAGQLEVTKFLIEEKKCDLTKTYEYETGAVWNVLHMASDCGRLDIARYLIEEKQFDPMSKANTDLTPLIVLPAVKVT